MRAFLSRQKAIRRQQVHTGPAGLSIPELPEDASDDEIAAALANLDAAKERLSFTSKALAEDAREVLLSLGPEIPEEEAIGRVKRIRDELKSANESITDLSGIGDL